MGHEHLTRAVVELMEIRKTAASPDRILHHAPKTFKGDEHETCQIPDEGRTG